MKATLIQCTNSKKDYPCIGYDMYSESAYFRKMRDWAIQSDGKELIVSAKYGLVRMDEIIEPYDERGIDPATAKEVATELDDIGVTHATVCMGSKDYLRNLLPELDSRDISVRDPFNGLRIGERMAKLDKLC